MEKRGLIFFAVLVLLVPFSYADIDWIYESQSAEFDVSIISDMWLTSNVHDLRVNLTMHPLNSDFQKIISEKTEPQADNYQFYWPNPQSGKLSFRVDSKVKSSTKFMQVSSKVKFPLKLEAGFENYLESDELVDFNGNGDIIGTATLIASGEDDLYKVVHKLGKWIRENVTYDLDPQLVFSSQKASWVMQHRKAVCDEMSTLMIAFCRALGIPARFVTGYAYTESQIFAGSSLIKEGWGPHAWVEVYFPGYGWAPFDTTYGQIGDVDLGHIELRKGASVSTSSASYSWYGGDVSTSPLNVTVTKIAASGLSESPIIVSAKFMHEQAGFGSYDVIEADITNTKNYYQPITILSDLSDVLDTLGENIQYVLLEPGKTKKVFWLVKAHSNLDRRNRYKAAISVNAIMGNAKKAYDVAGLELRYDLPVYTMEDMEDLISSLRQQETKTYSNEFEILCGARKQAYIGENEQILCGLSNNGNTNLDGLKVCFNLKCLTIDLKINQKYNLSFLFTPSAVGGQELKITASNKDVSKISFVHVDVYEKPVVSASIVAPKSVKYEDVFDLVFNFTSNSPVDNFTLVLYDNNKQIKDWNIHDFSNQAFILNMKGTDLLKGQNNFRLVMHYSDLQGRGYESSEEFAILLEKLSFWQAVEYFFSHLFS